ncbi:hypothetical protein T05_7724 [Trichinella murrelli]|uniref:Uncharacterized protein n=1 Tax=Trichinella murrelli TaxID=144512 RepID=A0A0V0UIC8_9BILA|nr:hypothetical protein T05_7724 [Trichinella murrelli]
MSSVDKLVAFVKLTTEQLIFNTQIERTPQSVHVDAIVSQHYQVKCEVSWCMNWLFNWRFYRSTIYTIRKINRVERTVLQEFRNVPLRGFELLLNKKDYLDFSASIFTFLV